MRTREEHLAFCKQRALEYVDKNDVVQALTSMGSDMDKHPETKGHGAILLGFQFLMIGKLKSQEDMRRFIEGFN